MNNQTTTGNSVEPDNKETLSHKVADTLHQRLNEAADAAAKIERAIHEKAPQAREKVQEMGADFNKTAREFSDDLNAIAHKHPWAIAGGAIAFGFLMGAISRNR